MLRTLAHELVHVSDDCASGHRGTFAARAKALGLVGQMTSSEAGPVLTAELCTLAAVLGGVPARADAGHEDPRPPAPGRRARPRRFRWRVGVPWVGSEAADRTEHQDRLSGLREHRPDHL